MVLPYINMNPPQVYTYFPSWTLLPPCTIPLGRPSAPAPSIQYRASNLEWWLVSYMILYMLQYHSPKSSHPLPLPQSPKDCSIHQCLFCCLIHRVIVTIFLNSIWSCTILWDVSIWRTYRWIKGWTNSQIVFPLSEIISMRKSRTRMSFSKWIEQNPIGKGLKKRCTMKYYC